MAVRTNLKPKARKSTKGTPPAPHVSEKNLSKPASGEKVLLQFKVEPDIRRAFKVEAANRDIEMTALFLEMWEDYRAKTLT